MASLRKLRRRALHWQRYETSVYGPSVACRHRGFERYILAIWAERDRRNDGWWPWCVCATSGCDGGCWDEPELGRSTVTVQVGGGVL